MSQEESFIWILEGHHLLLKCRNPDQIPSATQIAHSLSQINRWTGWARYPISVAQHSVLVSFLVRPSLALHGLLHDAHECLIGDVNTPVKRWIESERLEQLAEMFDVDCAEAFGLCALTQIEQKELRVADLLAAYLEAKYVVGVPLAELKEHFKGTLEVLAHRAPPEELLRLPASPGEMLSEMSWRDAKTAFMRRYSELV